mmetsp:Transcript_10838/g.11259  ORF Transcript_10838/g.11259 Transcript_10838/m.11259 type:complete len:99 (+) Transcript_10838:46-342(+)
MTFFRTFKSSIKLFKRNFAAPVKRQRKVPEPEKDVPIAWASVIYRLFFFTGYVIGPVYIMNGGLDDPPPYVPPKKHGDAHQHEHEQHEDDHHAKPSRH